MAERILIVDDDPETVRLVKLMLGRQGYNIITANSGQQALELIEIEKPDLIVLDIMMPEMDGLQVTRQIRANPRTAEIPILIFTAKTQVDDKVAGYEAGADEYISKPIHPAELVARIKALLARRKPRTGPLHVVEKTGHVIGVIAPKGGLGTSSLTLNLAVALRKFHKSEVVAAEFRPGKGTWAFDLGLNTFDGLNRLLEHKTSELNASMVESELLQTNFGVRLLTTTNKLADITMTRSGDQLEMVLQYLSSLSPLILLDIGANILPNIDSILEMCDELILVTDPNPITAEMARQLKNELQEKGFGKAKYLDIVLINRVRADLQLSPAEIQEILGKPLAEVIPPAPELAFHAAKNHVPLIQLQQDSLLSQQFKRLSDAIVERLGQ